MIRILFPLIASVILILLFGLLQVLFFRLFNKEWWQKKWLRKIIWTLPVIGVLSVFLWGIGEYRTNDLLAYPGAIIAVLVFIFEFCLFLSLPFSGILHFLNRIVEKFTNTKEREPKPIDQHRRRILKSTAAALPLLTLTVGGSGVVQAISRTKVFKKEISFNNLPDDLNGLRILHLSDIHLRHYVTLNDIEEMLLEAEKYSPDLTLITGDIADDLRLLPDALKLFNQLNPRFGTFASLGNHEYFRGVEQVRRHFDRSPVPLFIDKGVRIPIGNSTLFIGGIDDPRRMGAKEYQFFKTAIDKMLVDDSTSDFKVLMSHRPDALDYASEKGIDLTLAGHTHGGQIGFGRRSLFESYFPDRYLWGDYFIGESKLYTSSGVGHWFPFRLGCPAEAPVIELVKN